MDATKWCPRVVFVDVQINIMYARNPVPVMCILRGYLEKTLQIWMAQDGSDGVNRLDIIDIMGAN